MHRERREIRLVDMEYNGGGRGGGDDWIVKSVIFFDGTKFFFLYHPSLNWCA